MYNSKIMSFLDRIVKIKYKKGTDWTGTVWRWLRIPWQDKEGWGADQPP
jgi:hypothetical protein